MVHAAKAQADCSHSSTFVSPTVGPTQVSGKEIIRLDRIVRRRRSARRVDLALQARAPGGVGGRCSAGRRPGGSARGGCGRRSAASPGTRRGPSAPALGVRVRLRCPHRRHDDLATLRAEHLVEAAGELRVPIAEQEAHPPALVLQHQQETPGLLGDSATVGVGGHASEVAPAGVQLDEEQHV
jgi:hypothetical protein